MKQRLAIASALLNDPEILILDEPTNGLDPQGIRQIRDLIRIIANQGTTILLASHLLDEVEKVCSHVIVIRNGVTLYQGTVDGITANEGFFELESENLEQLKSALQHFSQIEKIEKEENKLLVYLNNNLEPAELNSLFIPTKYHLNPFGKTQTQFRRTIFRINETNLIFKIKISCTSQI